MPVNWAAFCIKRRAYFVLFVECLCMKHECQRYRDLHIHTCTLHTQTPTNTAYTIFVPFYGVFDMFSITGFTFMKSPTRAIQPSLVRHRELGYREWVSIVNLVKIYCIKWVLYAVRILWSTGGQLLLCVLVMLLLLLWITVIRWCYQVLDIRLKASNIVINRLVAPLVEKAWTSWKRVNVFVCTGPYELDTHRSFQSLSNTERFRVLCSLFFLCYSVFVSLSCNYTSRIYKGPELYGAFEACASCRQNVWIMMTTTTTTTATTMMIMMMIGWWWLCEDKVSSLNTSECVFFFSLFLHILLLDPHLARR